MTSRNKPRPDQAISDEKWRVLRQLSGLPDDARSDVEGIVHFLREKPSLKPALMTELQTARENMRNAIKSLVETDTSLAALLKCGVNLIYHPLKVDGNNDARAIGRKQEIITLRKLIGEIKLDLEYSERQMPYVSRGRPKSHLPLAIGSLNDLLLEKTARPLDQRKRRKGKIDLIQFSLEALRLADPSLTVKKIQNLTGREQSRHSEGSAPRRKRSSAR